MTNVVKKRYRNVDLAEIGEHIDDYIEEIIAEKQLSKPVRYSTNKLTRRETSIVIRNIIFNRTSREIIEEINELRKAENRPLLEQKDINLGRLRWRFRDIVATVRKYLFSRITEVYAHANPIFVINQLDHIAGILYKIGVEDGIALGAADRNTIAVMKLYFRSIDILNRIIKSSVEMLTEEEKPQEDVGIDIEKFIKKLKVKYDSLKDISEKQILNEYLNERYRDQI